MSDEQAKKYRVEYLPTQSKILKSQAKAVFMIAGLGSGKSFVIGAFTKHRASKVYYDASGQRHGTLGLIVAPSKDVLRDSTMPQVQKAWEKMGLFEDEHYVVGRQPPDHWGIDAYSSLHQANVITFYWGSYILVGGLDNYNRYRGPEFDYIAVDEFRDVKKEAWKVLVGRLRGQAFKELDLRHQILCATTPPEDFAYLEKILAKPDTDMFVTSSYENEENLPEEYISDMLARYDEITAQREIFGQLVNANRKPFAYAYTPAIHDYEEGTVEILPEAALYLSFDFNVEPMSCVIGQKGHGWANIIDEIKMVGSPHDVCDEIKHRYPGFRYLVTGDREGYSRQKAIRGNPNMFRMIAKELNLSYNEDVIAPKANRELRGSKGSRVLVNSVLQNHPRFRIDKKCRGVRADLRNARVDAHGDLVKSRKDPDEFLDLFDGFRYLLDTWFPKWLDSERLYY